MSRVGVPPPALTRMSGVDGPAEKMITPSGPQAPPRPICTAQTTCTESPLRSMVFNWPSAKNPRERLSGDQKGKIAPSVPGSARASSEFMERIQSAVLPSSPVAAKAIDAPSGERTSGPAASPVRLSVVLSGGLMTARILFSDGWKRGRKLPATSASTTEMTIAIAQPSRSRVFEGACGEAAATGDDRSAAIHCSSNLMSCAV